MARHVRRLLPLALTAVLASATPAAALERGVATENVDRLAASTAVTNDVCTAAQKAQRQRALAAYLRTMMKDRRAFFRTHKSPSVRRAFVRRQQARLRALRKAAGCTVIPARIVATIPIPNSGGVGVGAGSVWVVDRGSGLVRVDPATNSVSAQVADVRGGGPVVGEGAVWVPSALIFNRLLRVDLDGYSVTQIATGPSTDELPIAAVLTPGAVWVANHHGGTVVRIDPRTNEIVASIRWASPGTTGGIYHMATDGSHIWATASRTSEVTKIDTATNSIVGRTMVPTGACGGITVDASAVWITSGFDRPYTCWSPSNWGVSRIDRATGEVSRIDVGGRPIDVRVAFGSTWVLIDAPRMELVRIDPVTYRVIGRLRLAPGRCDAETTGDCVGAEYTTALAVGFGALWVRLANTPQEMLRIEPNP